MVSHCIAAEASLRRFKGRINGDVSFLSSGRDDERVNARPSRPSWIGLNGKLETEMFCRGMFSKYCEYREK